MAQIPDVHLMPTNDKIQHYDSCLCPCVPEEYGHDATDEPRVNWYLHNAADGREDRPLREAVAGWIVVGPKWMGDLYAVPLPSLN